MKEVDDTATQAGIAHVGRTDPPSNFSNCFINLIKKHVKIYKARAEKSM